MKITSNSQPVENMRSTGSSHTGPALLMILCVLGMLGTLLAGLHCLSLAESAQTQATGRWVVYWSDFHLEHFYKIQKEQLQLRLNELAIREDLDNLVLENYRLRIAEYAGQVETAHKKSVQEDDEAHGYEAQRDRNLRRSRWLMSGAAGFVLVLACLMLHVLAGGKGFMVAALLLVVISLAVCGNAFLQLWR